MKKRIMVEAVPAMVGPATKEPMDEMVGAYQVQSSTHTVWVNGPDGSCVARFSRAGIDIHKPAREQMETGEQCLDCKPGWTTKEDWIYFTGRVQELFGVDITYHHKPIYLREEA